MENKRKVSVLIPYKIKDGNIFVFLQKRADDAKILPGHFAFFGGKLEEGESYEQALEREIQEELGFTLKDYALLGRYDFVTAVANVYFLKVVDDFEEQIKVTEGDYGKFFSEEEVLFHPMIIDGDKKVLKDLYTLISGK